MKPVNIFALTRITDRDDLSRMERQMSGREHLLDIKSWEIESLRDFTEKLCTFDRAPEFFDFYYSFLIPKLGKEFDLVRVSDDFVLNVELKSAEVSDDAIRRQLLKNRYYISSLGRNAHFYTYVSSQQRLLRLTESGGLVRAEWSMLEEDLIRQGTCYQGDLEDLFREDQFLISPHRQPERFLQGEYFLTSQQRDIQRRILKGITGEPQGPGPFVWAFTGAPGTGKTLLLYDLAMKLSHRQRVCVFHGGVFTQEMVKLNERLKRIDFYPGDSTELISNISDYRVILADEAHKIDSSLLQALLAYRREAQENGENIPLIMAFDDLEIIAPEERNFRAEDVMDAQPDMELLKLTNRIRASAELSSFIRCMMQCSNWNHRRAYPNIYPSYADNDEDAKRLIHVYEQKGYTFVGVLDSESQTGSAARACIILDEQYWYDNCGYLRHGEDTEKKVCYPVCDLFESLGRAKESIALIVKKNPEVFEVILTILQGNRFSDR